MKRSADWIEDGALFYEMYSSSRDCDGPLDRHYIGFCRLWDLQAGYQDQEMGITFPEWHKVSNSQRDHYAELAGY